MRAIARNTHIVSPFTSIYYNPRQKTKLPAPASSVNVPETAAAAQSQITLGALKENEQAAALHVQSWARKAQMSRYLLAGGAGTMDSMPKPREAQSYSHTQATLPYATMKFKRPDPDSDTGFDISAP